MKEQKNLKNKKDQDKKLTPRQWELYNYLKSKGDQVWTTQLDIVRDVDYGYDYDYADLKVFHDSKARHQLTKDIRELNKCGTIHKIILSTSKGIKIATKDEADKWLDRLRGQALAKLKRVSIMVRKYNNDNQYRLKLSKYQEEIYKTFLDDDDKDKGGKNE